MQCHAAAGCAHILRLCKLCHHSQSIHLHVNNVLGRVPMIQCFVTGNTQPTIPYLFRTQRGRAAWAANTRPDGWNGSRLYELNLWMWHYCLGQERKVSVLHAMEERAKIVREARARACETCRRLAARAGDTADAMQ